MNKSSLTHAEQIQFVQSVIVAMAEYVAVTDHLFDSRNEPRVDYDYHDDAEAWERMVTPRNNVKTLLDALITYE